MCDCIDKIEKTLSEQFHEARISISYLLDRPEISVKPSGLGFEFQEFKKDGTPKPKKSRRELVPTFCPWCGVKYDTIVDSMAGSA